MKRRCGARIDDENSSCYVPCLGCAIELTSHGGSRRGLGVQSGCGYFVRLAEALGPGRVVLPARAKASHWDMDAEVVLSFAEGLGRISSRYCIFRVAWYISSGKHPRGQCPRSCEWAVPEGRREPWQCAVLGCDFVRSRRLRRFPSPPGLTLEYFLAGLIACVPPVLAAPGS